MLLVNMGQDNVIKEKEQKMQIFGLPLKTFLTVVLVPIGIIIALFIWGMIYKPSN